MEGTFSKEVFEVPSGFYLRVLKQCMERLYRTHLYEVCVLCEDVRSMRVHVTGVRYVTCVRVGNVSTRPLIHNGDKYT